MRQSKQETIERDSIILQKITYDFRYKELKDITRAELKACIESLGFNINSSTQSNIKTVISNARKEELDRIHNKKETFNSIYRLIRQDKTLKQERLESILFEYAKYKIAIVDNRHKNKDISEALAITDIQTFIELFDIGFFYLNRRRISVQYIVNLIQQINTVYNEKIHKDEIDNFNKYFPIIYRKYIQLIHRSKEISHEIIYTSKLLDYEL